MNFINRWNTFNSQMAKPLTRIRKSSFGKLERINNTVLANQSRRTITTKNKLFTYPNIHHPNQFPRKKVSIVGVGQVGMAAANALLLRHVSRDIVLIDQNEKKLYGECLDMQHALAYMKSTHISASTDFEISTDSQVVIVTAGARQRENETRLELLERNAEIYQNIIPEIAKYSPHAVIIVVSNPCDIMSWMTWKFSGFPAERVFGSGTALDSSRLRVLIAERLGVDARSVHGTMIGEHGDTSLALWSNLQVGGVTLSDLNPNIGSQTDDPELWYEIEDKVRQSAYEVIKAKGYTSWAIGICCAELVEAILRDERRILPLSVNAKGFHGIEDDIFLSLPVTLGSTGAYKIINSVLSKEEQEKLLKSAETLKQMQDKLNF